MTYIANNTSDISPSTGDAAPIKQSDSLPVSRSFFDEFQSSGALIIGIITSILSICTIGFFVLLAFYLNRLSIS